MSPRKHSYTQLIHKLKQNFYKQNITLLRVLEAIFYSI